MADPEFTGLVQYLFPDRNIEELFGKYSTFQSLDDFQAHFALDAIKVIEKRSIKQLSYSGLEKLDEELQHLGSRLNHLFDNFKHLLSRRSVEAAADLVKDHEDRIGDKGPGNHHLSRLTLRHGKDTPPPEIADAEETNDTFSTIDLMFPWPLLEPDAVEETRVDDLFPREVPVVPHMGVLTLRTDKGNPLPHSYGALSPQAIE